MTAMPKVIETLLPGCLVFEAFSACDARGSFCKPFSSSWGSAFGSFAAKEFFYSTSARGVLRGMHLQTGNAAHAKIVFCIEGEILDVVLDLRQGAGFGASNACRLSARNRLAILVPPGLAHGFLTLSESATVGYLVATPHDPAQDTGVRWNSFGFAWPPVGTVSSRDANLPRLDDFPPQPETQIP
jgi:dTDP-4-dehydrorhamnose 3,5-epimerase